MRTLIQLLLTLLTLAALIWVVWQGYLLIDSRGQQMEAAQRSMLVGVSLIALVCTFMLTSSIRSAANERARASLMQRRGELYESFVNIWQSLKKEMKEGQKAKLQLQADEFKSSIGLYGSMEVIKRINLLLEQAAREGPHQSQAEFEELLLAMRSDLGQDNIYPIRNEIQKLFTILNT
ncbi:MAG: hypothetical protein KDD10_28525 [Phaeodactylibacter sp.]|nr:hypothetical protein [Phaeodactylibacter sp.]MCB9292673.1 hypothetical protein [Lewinellaceae bacterium]